MRIETIPSIKHPFKYSSLWLLAAAICLFPAAAQALDATSTAYGTGALANESSGAENTANGYNALNQTTGGFGNTAIGTTALRDNTNGNNNTASGSGALISNTTGESNTASGNSALSSNITGSQNTANGVLALVSNTTGHHNTASGYEALYNNTTGRNNVAVGANALFAINGSNNIALGFNAGKNTTSGNNNIYIGHSGRNGSESRVMRIGKAQRTTFIAGIASRAQSGTMVVVKPNGLLGVDASSARYKQDIRSLGDASGKLARLRPVSYRYKAEPQTIRYGLIAEEVDKVMPELVVRDDKNRPESVQYLEIIPLLLQERQEQQAKIARLGALVEQLAAEVAELRRTRLADNAAPKN